MLDRPYVTINVAMTADGKTDTISREGRLISSAGDMETDSGEMLPVDAISDRSPQTSRSPDFTQPNDLRFQGAWQSSLGQSMTGLLLGRLDLRSETTSRGQQYKKNYYLISMCEKT